MLIWADGFGTYGDTNHFRASGLYVYNADNPGPPLQIGVGGIARTGGYYWDCSNIPYADWNAGRMFGGNQPTIGLGAAFYFPGLPATNYFCPFFLCGDTKNSFQCSVRLNSDGSLALCSGNNGGAYVTSAAGVITPGAFQYIEVKVFCDPVNGTIECRVNNNTVALAAGVNTDPLGLGHINGFMTGNRGGSPFTGICSGVADLVIYDGQGLNNNDFIGDCRCRTFLASTDGPVQDWIATGGGDAFAEIDNVPYDDAHNISAANIGDVSNFGKPPLPTNTAYVAGVNVFTTANKSDAGDCEITPQIVGSDGATVADLPPISPGTGSAVYTGIQETDPFTGLLFTRVGFDTALMQVERTA